jgi:hypothetical protein
MSPAKESWPGIEAIEKLKIAELAIAANGISVNSPEMTRQQQQAFFGGGNARQEVSGKVGVSESLVIAVAGIEKMKPEEVLDLSMKVIDAGKDAGLTIGPKPMTYYELQMSYNRNISNAIVNFRLKNVDAHRAAAYTLAMDDARANAERLAKLAGVKLGKILSITEVGGEYQTVQTPTGSMRREPEYVSGNFKPIPVMILVKANFAIE